MRDVQTGGGTVPVDIGLLFLRVSASLLLLAVHGLPKILDYPHEAAVIEDPFHLGRTVSIGFAIFAEVLCPPLMMLGFFTRFAAVPILIVTLIAVTVVHRNWTLAEGQFAWMLLILFGTIAVAGPGRYSLDGRRTMSSIRTTS